MQLPNVLPDTPWPKQAIYGHGKKDRQLIAEQRIKFVEGTGIRIRRAARYRLIRHHRTIR